MSGFQSDIAPIRTLLLRHVRDAFVDQARIRDQWAELSFVAPPDLKQAVEEYERLVAVLKGAGIRLEYLPRDDTVTLDSVYVRDASVLCEKGAILGSMGKDARRSEPATLAPFYRDAGVPVHGAITGTGRLEGGDLVWLDQRTVAVGRGYRTNDEGIRQLGRLLEDCIDEMIVVPLPHWRGRQDVFHLMSILSPLDADLVLVFSPLLPVPFREALLDRGFQLVEVPDSEFESQGCNVLALAPRHGLMIEGNPETRSRLEAAGVRVDTFPGEEICRKGGGGPTCLTRPLVRGGSEG